MPLPNSALPPKINVPRHVPNLDALLFLAACRRFGVLYEKGANHDLKAKDGALRGG